MRFKIEVLGYNYKEEWHFKYCDIIEGIAVKISDFIIELESFPQAGVTMINLLSFSEDLNLSDIEIEFLSGYDPFVTVKDFVICKDYIKMNVDMGET